MILQLKRLMCKEDRQKIREMIDDAYTKGYAEANAQIKPVIQRIHDCVFQEGYEKGKAEGMWSQWKRPSDKLPADGDVVLVVVNGKYKRIIFDNAFQIADYSEVEGWILQEFPGAEDIIISLWTELPDEKLVNKILS